MAAARANLKLGLLPRPIAEAIIQASGEIIRGKLRDQFVVDMIQGGAGTSTNMNANEARCRELVENSIGLVTILSPLLGYEICTELTREASEKGCRVYDLVIAKKILTKNELDRRLHPENMIRPLP